MIEQLLIRLKYIINFMNTYYYDFTLKINYLDKRLRLSNVTNRLLETGNRHDDKV